MAVSLDTTKIRISSTGRSPSQLFDIGLFSLQNGQYTDAYLAFYPLCHQGIESDAAALFNLALCLMQAGACNDAVEYLEKAIAAVKGQCANVFMELKRGPAYQTLIQRESDSDCYKMPMHSETPILFPRNARGRMLRLLVDALVACKRWADVHRLAGGLVSTGHYNIVSAFHLAEKHLAALNGETAI